MTALPGPLVVVTDRVLAEPRSLPDVVARAVEGGARAVLLREKDLPDDERADLADTLRALLTPVGGRLLVASRGAGPDDGLHLAADDPWPTGYGPMGDRPPVVGRSCHDLAEVRAAHEAGCDYVTLSPIFPTPSKPDYGPPLGVGVLEEAASLGVPVLALGGVRSGRGALVMRTGVAGVAVMGHVMRAGDPARAVHGLLHELGACHCDLVGRVAHRPISARPGGERR